MQSDSQFLQPVGRAALPVGHERVAHVLEIRHAHLAGEKAAGGQLTEAVEEGDAVGMTRLRLPPWPGDVIENGLAIRVRRCKKRLREPPLAFGIEPRESAAHRGLPGGLVDHHEVHELRHAGVRGTARLFIFRNDEIDQHADGRPLVRVEKLRLVPAQRARGGLLRLLRGLTCGLNISLAPRNRGRRDGRSRERSQRLSSIHARHQRLPFLRSSAMNWLVRSDSARIVQVGFLSDWVTNGPPSVTNTFFTSCAWQFLFRTDVDGLLPIRVVPISWMMTPPAASPYCAASVGMLPSGTPPISVMMLRKVSCMCFACFTSWPANLKRNRSTGIPNLSTVLGSISQ